MPWQWSFYRPEMRISLPRKDVKSLWSIVLLHLMLTLKCILEKTVDIEYRLKSKCLIWPIPLATFTLRKLIDIEAEEESVLLSKHFLNNPSQYWIWIDMICVVSTALSHDKKIALNSKYSQDCKEFEYRLKYFRLNLNFLVAFLDAFSIPISNRKFFEIKVHEKQKVKVRLKSMPFSNTSRVIPLRVGIRNRGTPRCHTG